MSDVRTCGHEGDRNSIEVGARFDGVRWFLCDPCMAAMRGGDASVVGVPCMRCGKVGPVGQRFKQATLGGEEPRGYDGAFTLDPYLCVACVEREEARRAMDDDEPDPRVAHGPAWAAGTPHTDEEAAIMLGQAEPRHALRERMHHRMQRTLRCVVLEPSPRVTAGEPMPAATMPAAEWREAWRAAEVPVLCALRERCEASGARVALPLRGFEPHPSYVDRYANSVRWGQSAPALDVTIDEVYRLEPYRVRGRDHVPADAEGADDAQRARDAARLAPLPWLPRGWCEGLATGALAAALRDDEPAATWQSMRDACPERVYPEPTQT